MTTFNLPDLQVFYILIDGKYVFHYPNLETGETDFSETFIVPSKAEATVFHDYALTLLNFYEQEGFERERLSLQLVKGKEANKHIALIKEQASINTQIDCIEKVLNDMGLSIEREWIARAVWYRDGYLTQVTVAKEDLQIYLDRLCKVWDRSQIDFDIDGSDDIVDLVITNVLSGFDNIKHYWATKTYGPSLVKY